MGMYGIDISEHNGNIDLSAYKNQFVIIRVGYGIAHLDKKFERNVNECIRLGIPFGFYWYSYALNAVDAKKEAEFFIKTIAPYKSKIRVGVWFDMEDADGYKRRHGFVFTKLNVTTICNTFCDIVAKAGYYVGVYASRSWFGTYIECPKYDKWVASWGVNDGKMHGDTSALGSLHQYTSKPLDKNYMYGNISRYNPNVKKEKTTYKGEFPTKFPKRIVPRFKLGDGYQRNVGYKEEIKKIQKFLNWAIDAGLTVDGNYGPKTVLACKKFQEKLGMKNPKGNFGIGTLKKAKAFKA